ncbi:beta-glucosidase 12-like isoform X3 [Rhododendron vialii]|uniref:beta-glucosidase 12-like isoform X3 n=1 Tax=Rhododendron vialii TaxID=182163 RepID=UPI00265F0ABE|nr:beta-glucosidase 12-like isoform X3 [Rhododendron vialii]
MLCMSLCLCLCAYVLYIYIMQGLGTCLNQYPVMRIRGHLFPGMLIVVNLFVFHCEALSPTYGTDSLNRSSFPVGFVFGAASSAYQVEGAANEGGKGPSIWDCFTKIYPNKIKDGSNGNVAVDSYHRYKEDVAIMKDMGLDAYRFSIAWSRVLPRLEPFVTLFHWDLPQALEDEYGGFLDPQIVVHYRDYADLCFREFGDRVKYWITLNEPWTYSIGGYENGLFAPGRCSWQQQNCTGGNSSTEPYLVTHHQLLAHAAVARLYKQKYQATQEGKVGITLVTRWMVPLSDSTPDHNAVLRALDFMFGWFMDPLTTGDYPYSIQSLVGNRLPKFTDEQSKMLNGSFDFLGLNYYSASYAAHVPDQPSNRVNVTYTTDSQVRLTTDRNGVAIGEKGASDWLYVYPRGLWDLLLHIKRNYNNPLIYITENGIDEVNNSTLSLDEALVDNQRIYYYHHHLSFLLRAIKEEVNVKGFLAWSLMDNFEWYSGYTVRFGLTYVDYNDGLRRYPKLSAKWFKNFLQK